MSLQYETTMRRAAAGLAAGAAVGCVGLTCIAHSAWAAQWLWAASGAFEPSLLSLAAFCLFWVFSATGLCIGFVPMWAVLHNYRRRHWTYLTALGAGLCLMAPFLLLIAIGPLSGNLSASDAGGDIMMDGRLTEHGWIGAWREAALSTPIGAAMGYVVWRIAYRKADAS